MTEPQPQKKLAPWSEGKTIEARIWCPKCGKSKVIEGYDNAFWWSSNLGGKSTQCDSCRTFIHYKITKDGVET